MQKNDPFPRDPFPRDLFPKELTFSLDELPPHTREVFLAHEAERVADARTMDAVRAPLEVLLGDGDDNAAGWLLTISYGKKSTWSASIFAVSPRVTGEAELIFAPEAGRGRRPDCVCVEKWKYTTRQDLDGELWVEVEEPRWPWTRVGVHGGARDGSATPDGGFTWTYCGRRYTLTPPAASKKS